MSNIKLIGVPLDYGQKIRGVDMAPGSLRGAGIATVLRNLGHSVEDSGNIKVPLREDENSSGDNKQNFYDIVAEVCEDIYTAGKKAMAEASFPLFLGGDHSITIGTVGGISENYTDDTGLIWLDAHIDYNTEKTSLTGNIHGMPLAALLGQGNEKLVNVGRNGPKVLPENVVGVGIRYVDPVEKELLRDSNIKVWSMRDIDEKGIGRVMDETLERLADKKRLHLTFDIDALDPLEAPGVGVPVPGGLTFREARLIMEKIADTGALTSMDMVEINPTFDTNNKTTAIAVEFISSLMGKILV